jgi:DNA-binding transcriptional LysR family regulator
MNLDYIRTYLEVIKLGSFSEVAKKLSLSQPAVSFQIQKLEHELGTRLLDRNQKIITVTEAGKRFARFAESVEEEQNRLRSDLDRMRDEITGDLIVTASTIPGEFILPPLLAEFKALHPTIGIHLTVSDSVCVIEGVRNSDYDIGFCGIAPDGHDLEYIKIAEDEIVLIVPPQHPLADNSKISIADMEGESFICREKTSGTQRSLQAYLLQAGINLMRAEADLVMGTTQALVTAVESGAGIAFVSNLAIKKSLALGLVKAVEVNGFKLNRDFFVVYRKERIVSRLLVEFIEFIKLRALWAPHRKT